MSVLRRWPPALWLPVYVGSEFILLGSRGRPGMLILGGALALLAWGSSMYLALGPWPGHPRSKYFGWAIGGVGAFYLICAFFAGLANTDYIGPVLAAGVIPMTAASLLAAMVRSKTIEREGRMRDASAADSQDPTPGFGMDDATEMGDTPERGGRFSKDQAEEERASGAHRRGQRPGGSPVR